MSRLSFLLIAIVATIAQTQVAPAADLPRKAPVYTPPPPPVFSWTGFYVGGNAGYARGRANATYVAPGLPIFIPADTIPMSANGSGSLDPKGFVGGAQIGYNWQFAPTWVLGVEADFQAFNLSDSFDRTIVLENFQHATHTQVSADWLFTLRGRLGYAFDRWLVYGTGGLAVAKVNFQQINAYPSLFAGDPPFSPTDFFSASDTRTGWTVGGGVEYAFLNNWSVKAEYLHVDLGTIGGTSTTIDPSFPAVLVSSHSTDFKADIVRAGINYRFN